MADEVKIYGIREDNKCFERVLPLAWKKSYTELKKDFTAGDAGSAYIKIQNPFGKDVTNYTVDCRYVSSNAGHATTPIPAKGDAEEVLKSNEVCCYWSTTMDTDKNVTTYISIGQAVYNQMSAADIIAINFRRY